MGPWETAVTHSPLLQMRKERLCGSSDGNSPVLGRLSLSLSSNPCHNDSSRCLAFGDTPSLKFHTLPSTFKMWKFSFPFCR